MVAIIIILLLCYYIHIPRNLFSFHNAIVFKIIVTKHRTKYKKNHYCIVPNVKNDNCEVGNKHT